MLSFGLRIKWCIFVKEFTQLLHRLLKFGFIANIVTTEYTSGPKTGPAPASSMPHTRTPAGSTFCSLGAVPKERLTFTLTLAIEECRRSTMGQNLLMANLIAGQRARSSWHCCCNSCCFRTKCSLQRVLLDTVSAVLDRARCALL